MYLSDSVTPTYDMQKEHTRITYQFGQVKTRK